MKFRHILRLSIVIAFAALFACSFPLSSTEPEEEVVEIFNGRDLSGWVGSEDYWSVEDGQIVGASEQPVPRNEFLFSEGEFEDFYFAVSVRLVPDQQNSGIQFRSSRDDDGHAAGYQADIGAGWWGKLYHEHGRGLLDDPETGQAHTEAGEWNRYEILAVGPHIWTAINGHVSVAVDDPEGERRGRIALQMHSGDPLEVRWKELELVEDPSIELGGLGQEELKAMLRAPLDAAAP